MMRRAALAVVLLAAPLAACSPLGSGAPATVTVTATAGTAGAASPPAAGLSASDVVLTLRIMKKQCFGTAGCSITYRPEASVTSLDLIHPGESYDVTYAVTGAEDGETIGTLTLKDDGTYDLDETTVDTKNSKTALTIKVTEVRRTSS